MFDLKFAEQSFGQILSAVPMTLLVGLGATLIGLVLAIFVVVIRERKIPILNPLCATIVSFIRGTPILVQLYVVYYGLPRLLGAIAGTDNSPTGMPAIVIAFTAYSLNAMANLSESIRAAYHSVDPGQREAGLVVGMSPWTTQVRIVIPQLITNFLPNFTNIMLDLIKDTALIYNIGLTEIMGEANIISSEGFKYLETYVDALIIYIVICWLFIYIFRLVETLIRRHYAVSK